MRLLLILVLSLSVVHEASGFFGLFNSILNAFVDVLDFGVNLFAGVIKTGINIGGSVIGVVVDPFDTWSPSADDHGHSTGTVVKCPAIADIIILLDTSGSMSRSEFSLSTTFASRLTEHFKISKNDVLFGGIVFSDNVQKFLGLGDAQDSVSLKSKFTNAPYLGGGTKTYTAIDYITANGMFSTYAGARARSSKIVIVVTDGNSDSLLKTTNSANALKAAGVEVISVGVGSGLGVELERIASGYKNVFTADSFNELTRIEATIARRICEIPAEQGNIPIEGATCQKGYQPNPQDPQRCVDIDECSQSKPACSQNCVNSVGGFRCYCNDGYVIDPKDTTKCQTLQVCTALADIILVLDASGSIGAENFKTQQRFLARLTKDFTYGARGAQYAALLFASAVQKLFDFNANTVRSDVSSALLAAPYLTGGTNTHLALNYITENNMFSTTKGARSNAADVVIVLTDGKSSRPDETATAAQNLKNKGYRILSVGIGNQIDTEEISRLASSPDDSFLVADYDLLLYVEQRLAARVCKK